MIPLLCLLCSCLKEVYSICHFTPSLGEADPPSLCEAPSLDEASLSEASLSEASIS